jgi:Tol biopolymer transport system component/DNA-binding winged helix-turn-helix (wHTH) protein
MMEPSEHPNGRTQFGVFEVDARSGEVRKAGMRVKMQDQPFKVLLALLERPGEVVSRETLRERIWPNESFGDFDHAVNVAVAKLRTALNDSADSPRYIETLHRRGYRFIFPVGSLVGHPAIDGPGENHSRAGYSGNVAAKAANPVPPARAERSRAQLWTAALVTLAIVGAVTLWWSYRKPATPIPQNDGMQISRVTNSGNVGDVSISPDARYLVYVQRETGGIGLWTREVGTRSDIQILAAQPGYFQGITFSPDGRYLFFARRRPEGHPAADLYTMPVLGGTPRILLKDVDTPANFSRDGKQFMFIRKDLQRNVAEVRVANSDGSGERLVTTFEHAGNVEHSGGSWSPDGSKLAVSMTSSGVMHGPEELDIISLADGSRRRLYAGSAVVGRPVWLPGGREIAVVLLRAGLRQIWGVAYPSGQPHRITNDLEDYDEHIDVTADGKTLAATSWSGTGNIYGLPAADFSRMRQITFGREDLNIITTGADGRLLVHESGSPDGEIWAMKSDGSQRVLFSGLREAIASTHCGRFVILGAETGQLTRTDADGLNPLELVPSEGKSPTCPADGKFVYYADEISRPQRVMRMPIDGGPALEVTKIPGEGLTGGAAVSPNGKFLAFPYHESGPNPLQRLSIIRLDTGDVVKSFTGITGYVRWRPDGRAIAYFADRDGVQQVFEQTLAGGGPRQVTRFGSGKVRDFDWSIDGKELYAAHGETHSDAVLITNFR